MRVFKFWLTVVLLSCSSLLHAQDILHFEEIYRADSDENLPVHGAFPPGDPSKMFLVTKSGKVNVFDFETGNLLPAPFLTVNDISTGFESGLLSMTFHPNYAANGRFFVYYTDSKSNFVIEEYLRKNSTEAFAEGKPILSIPRPAPGGGARHNGGWMDFGPDGFLYIATGEGGPGSMQSQMIVNNLKGSILRIDVDRDDFPSARARNYAIPPGNPLVGLPGDDEILAYGLRNAWRCSIDPNGNLFIGDVGGTEREEINFLPHNHSLALNFGWPFFEGTMDTLDFDNRPDEPLILPIFDYEHTAVSSGVIGGHLYDGPIKELKGHYLYADVFDGFHIRSFRFDGTDEPLQFDGNNFSDARLRRHGIPNYQPFGALAVSFFEDSSNNLYFINGNGIVLRLDSIHQVGDLNLDANINLLDIQPFIDAMLSEGYIGSADINYDLVVNFDDIAPFVELITSD